MSGSHEGECPTGVRPLADPIWDDLFHACALAAYVRVAVETGREPDREQTRRLAYRLYEAALTGTEGEQAEARIPTRSENAPLKASRRSAVGRSLDPSRQVSRRPQPSEVES